MSARLLVSVFEREDDILHAAKAVRDEGLELVDVFTPYPVHGLDRAMGLPASRLPWVCFLLGLFGAVTMALFQYWASAVDWPINVGGKPWHSWPAFAPVIFEVAVLFAGAGTVLFFIAWTGLRPGRQSPVSDLRVTDDRFALAIRQAGPGFNRASVEALLSRFHPVSIEERDIPSGGRAA
jgi:hypothetical protein